MKKLVDFIAIFKSIKNKPRIEILFLAIIIIMLFLPMCHIDKKDKSRSENRTLAKYKPFIQDNKINYNYGRDFDNWFNDRFFLRKPVVKAYALNLLLHKPKILVVCVSKFNRLEYLFEEDK